MQQIARRCGCSVNKIVYWMDKYGFVRRGWSEATYVCRNPDGDPFTIRLPETIEERELFALAIGLYMGEGTKKGSHQVAMANSDPRILKIFLLFLEKFCGITKSIVSVWMNIYDDCDMEKARYWWANELGLDVAQFYNTAARTHRGGTYMKKSQYGTLTVSFQNTKLKLIIDQWCSEYYTKFFTTD
jgi:hypothetical protein